MEQKTGLTTNQVTLAVNDLIENIQDVFQKMLHHDNERLHLDVNDLLEAWLKFTRRVLIDTEQLSHMQLIYWQDYLLLCRDLTQRLTTIAESHQFDEGEKKRLSIIKNFIEKFYFLISQHVHIVIKMIFSENEEDQYKKIEFYTRQFTEAFGQFKWVKAETDALYDKLLK